MLCTSPNPEGWLVNTLKNVLSNMAHNRATASRIMTQYISTQIKELTVTEDRLRFELLYENVSDLEEFKLLKEMVIEGKSHLEMAQARGISIAACKKRVQRAKEVLRKNIKLLCHFLTLGYICVSKGGTGMPNNQNRSNQDFSRFDSMTNEELEEILRLDAQKTEGEESDLEMFLYVMEVLAVRRKNSENPGKTAGEAFETFKEHYMTDDSTTDTEQVPSKAQVINMKPTKRLRPWLSRLVATAAILALILVSSVTAHAMGIDIWDIIVTWTQETFQLRSGESDETNEAAANDQREYTDLQQLLNESGIVHKLAPSSIPDGYELVDLKTTESPVQLMYLAIYQNQGHTLKIQVKQYIGADPEQIEQSDSLIEEYESDGIIYYIFENHDELKAVWIKENFECYIAGVLTTAELKDMINSISGG